MYKGMPENQRLIREASRADAKRRESAAQVFGSYEEMHEQMEMLSLESKIEEIKRKRE